MKRSNLRQNTTRCWRSIALAALISLACTACALRDQEAGTIWQGRPEHALLAARDQSEEMPFARGGGLLAELRFVNQLRAASTRELRRLRAQAEREYATRPSAQRRLRLALVLGESNPRRAALLSAQALGEIAREDPARALALTELLSLIRKQRETQRQIMRTLRAAQAQLAQVKRQSEQQQRTSARLEADLLRERGRRRSVENTVEALKEIETHMRSREVDATGGSGP